MNRPALEQRWLLLTRDILPQAAVKKRWSIHADHCFQRVLLDNACGGRWYDHVVGRPAYRQVDDETLAQAVAMGEAVADGRGDLEILNARSLAWRRAAR